MSHILDRARTTLSDVELPATAVLRERLLDAVEQAVDRIEGTVEQPPRLESAREAARNVGRYTRRNELATAMLVAGAPAIVRAARDQVARRRVPAPTKRVPAVLVTRPALIGGGIAVALLGGYVALRIVRRRRRQLENDIEIESLADREMTEIDPRRFDLDEEVARMEDEGGEPAGDVGSKPQRRRFVRSDSHESTPTR